jgi:hypothetical protein
VRDAAEIERGISEFAVRPNGGLIITPNCLAIVHRALIIALAERYLPAIYPIRFFVSDGGLISVSHRYLLLRNPFVRACDAIYGYRTCRFVRSRSNLWSCAGVNTAPCTTCVWN